jgi:DME family drug/metabolite transporter
VALGTIITIGSSPLFAGLLDGLIGRQRPTRRWLLSAAITVAGGVLLVTSRDHGADQSPRDPALAAWGVIVGLLAGLTYAAYTWAAARLMAPADSRGLGLGRRGVIAAIMAVSTVPLLGVLVVTGSSSLGEASVWPVLLFLALVPTALGHGLFGRGLGSMSASTATVLTLFEPVVATVLAVLVVGEVLSAPGWLGLAAILLGLVILSLPAARPRSL